MTLAILIQYEGMTRYFSGFEEGKLVTTTSVDEAREFNGKYYADQVIDTLRHKFPENTYYIVILGA
jgi:hypothetical protein